MKSPTTQKTCNCTLEVTKCLWWAIDEMGVEMDTCKNLRMREGNMEHCKVFNVREMSMISIGIRHYGLKTPFSG